MWILVTHLSEPACEAQAQVVADTLSADGHHVAIRPCKEVHGLEAWDAIVVGDRAHRDAERFLRRHIDALQYLPVWFFTSDAPASWLSIRAALHIGPPGVCAQAKTLAA